MSTLVNEEPSLVQEFITPIPPEHLPSPGELGDSIRREWTGCMGALENLANYFSFALQEYEQSDFEKLAVHLGISPQKALDIAEVGYDDRIWRNAESMPADFSALHALTKLSDEEFELALSEREIRGDSTPVQIGLWQARRVGADDSDRLFELHITADLAGSVVLTGELQQMPGVWQSMSAERKK